MLVVNCEQPEGLVMVVHMQANPQAIKKKNCGQVKTCPQFFLKHTTKYAQCIDIALYCCTLIEEMKGDETMSQIEELFADIRNKLQPCKTVLETDYSKKPPPIYLIELALKNIENIEKSLDAYEKGDK